MIMRRILTAFIYDLLLLPPIALTAGPSEKWRPAGPGHSARVLLIPLDDRPPCLQFPEMIGLIGDTEVVAPPREFLGRFLVPGQPEKIAGWLRTQNLGSFDAAIISVDMLAYGGLVNSRVHRTALPDALKRLEVVRWIHRAAPQLPIYGSSVIMRLAPTADGRNEAYREKLARWAEISPGAARDSALREEIARLEKEVPPAALEDYKKARGRNFETNRAGIELVRSGVFDYLILSQDDAKPRGVHVADRERLIGEIKRLRLSEKIAVQPGADEVSMLLLARALNKRFNYSPRIAPIYSSETIRNRVTPFEDRPLHRTVDLHIAATGSREAESTEDADIIFYVYGSRAESGVAAKFAAQVIGALEQGRRVIVADIDCKGDVQGADPKFTEELRRRKVFPRLAGYAAWNTAGNTIGTALPHGIIYSRLHESLLKNPPARHERICNAQMKFLLHRLIDDYSYHSLVRPEAIKFALARGINPNGLTGEGLTLVENFIREHMRPHIIDLWKDFVNMPLVGGQGGAKTGGGCWSAFLIFACTCHGAGHSRPKSISTSRHLAPSTGEHLADRGITTE